LLHRYYNFVRPHRALEFGREVRTPVLQEGLIARRLTFREIFSSTMHFGALQNVTVVFFDSAMWSVLTMRTLQWQRSNTGWRKHPSIAY
jgi:hypothetical protein